MTSPSTTAGENVATAKHLLIVWCSLFLILLAGAVLITEGHPRSNWIYPFTLAVAVLGGLRIFRARDRVLGAGDSPPKSVGRAFVRATVAFIVFLAFAYVFYSLMWTEPFPWAVGLGVSGMTAVNVYRKKRGHAYSSWPGVVVLFGMMVAYFFLEWAGVVPRIHF